MCSLCMMKLLDTRFPSNQRFSELPIPEACLKAPDRTVQRQSIGVFRAHPLTARAGALGGAICCYDGLLATTMNHDLTPRLHRPTMESKRTGETRSLRNLCFVPWWIPLSFCENLRHARRRISLLLVDCSKNLFCILKKAF